MVVSIAGVVQQNLNNKITRPHRGCSCTTKEVRSVVGKAVRTPARTASRATRFSGGRCLRGLATDVPALVFYTNAGGRRAGILSDMIRMAALI